MEEQFDVITFCYVAFEIIQDYFEILHPSPELLQN